MLNPFKTLIFKAFSLAVLITSLDASTAYSKNKKSQHFKNRTFNYRTLITSSLVVDASTGKILYHNNGARRVYPASLTKLMTLYLTFEAIEAGKLKLTDYLYTSPNAAGMQPCKLGLKVGERIKVRDAILALIVKSSNDAAVVLAEAIGRTEGQFSELMNIRAKRLGMRHTKFKNASGWHHPEQKTSAVDIAKLAIALRRDFPQYYNLFSITEFKFKNKILHGHNHITRNYEGAEGLKTGYTSASGFNLVTAAMKGNKRLVAVVIGEKTARTRDTKMQALLDKHFGIQKVASIKPSKKLKRLSKRTTT